MTAGTDRRTLWGFPGRQRHARLRESWLIAHPSASAETLPALLRELELHREGGEPSGPDSSRV